MTFSVMQTWWHIEYTRSLNPAADAAALVNPFAILRDQFGEASVRDVRELFHELTDDGTLWVKRVNGKKRDENGDGGNSSRDQCLLTAKATC